MMRPLWMRRLRRTPRGTVTPRRTGCQTTAWRLDPTEVLGEVRSCFQAHVHGNVGVPGAARPRAAGLELEVHGVRGGDEVDEVDPVSRERDALVRRPVAGAVVVRQHGAVASRGR